MKTLFFFLIILSVQIVNSTNGKCGIIIAVDEPFFKEYAKENLTNLKQIIEDMVKKLNEIYSVLPNDVPEFFIQEVWQFMHFIPSSLDEKEVLEELSKYGTSQFCLVHLLTYRDFTGGLQGFAYVDTVCGKKQNTGFTTALNHQKRTSLDFVKLAFAHEIGHNLGASHDSSTTCKNDGNFLMGESIENETSELCQCTKKSIKDTLRHKRTQDCFQDRQPEKYSICGNYKVEGNEECDCGISFTTCNDPCCYASTISPQDLTLNSSATPCRTHRAPRCTHPHLNPLLFSVAYPFIFIVSAVFMLAIGLTIDWKTKKICFAHVAQNNVRIDTKIFSIKV